LTPAWNGGIYWAGQLRSAKTPEEQAKTKSLALFYLSVWRNSASAQAFAQLYADSLGRKYSGLKADLDAEDSAPKELPPGSSQAISEEEVYSTGEGPVVITTRGKMVFVAESFDLDLARKLTALVLDAQGTGQLKMAGIAQPKGLPDSLEPLTANLIRFYSNCGVMKAVVNATVQLAK
jgi:hypothetical protein